MHEEDTKFDYTEFEEPTKSELQPDELEPTFVREENASSTGLKRCQLIEAYQAICKQPAIYYPVAYRFIRELGRGRQGIVFLGMRQGARGCITRHAIKLFDPSIYTSSKSYWTDMGRVAAQTSKLQTTHNPNLVDRDIYEETNGIGYTQMEVIDGIDLKYFLRGKHFDSVQKLCSEDEWDRLRDTMFRLDGEKRALQPGIAVHIMRKMLRGLETLHDHGFVHGDIKPANIMIDRLGYIKLVDFGRAITHHEKINILLGSPIYMAPEIHQRGASSQQSDLYSVGIVGLEMLMGAPLVTKVGIEEEKLLELKMTLPDRMLDLLPEHVRQNKLLTDLLRRFIEPDPANRYANAVAAESGSDGLRVVHKQLTQLNKDTEYGRELGVYMNKCSYSGNE